MGEVDYEELWSNAPCGLLSTTPDGVIVAVNDTFLARTGYRRNQLTGRARLRDLLTPGGRIFYETHLAPLLAMQGEVRELALDIVCSDGARLPCLLDANLKRADPGGPELVRVAVVTVTDRLLFERELIAARERAELASEASARVQRRLNLLAEANVALASSMDVDGALDRLATRLADTMGDWCVIFRTEPDVPSRLAFSAAAHRDHARTPQLRGHAEAVEGGVAAESQLAGVLRGAGPVLLAAPEQPEAPAADPTARFYRAFGVASSLIVPMRARGRLVAVMLLGRTNGSRAYTADDLDDLVDLAARAALTIDNLRLYAREHQTSTALQQALLTAPPEPDHLHIVTRYRPAADGVSVGGDWYDAFVQPDGATILVIGDVAGHNDAAAAAMGQLRGLLRAIAYTSGDTPAGVLTRTDRAARGLQVDSVATVVVARVEQLPEHAIRGTRLLRWSNAGHLAPVVVSPDGTVEILERDVDLLLGVSPSVERQDHEVELAPGSTLLLYTDGLVEHRHSDLDDDVARLVALLATMCRTPLDDMCDALLDSLLDETGSDDVALLALRLHDEDEPRPAEAGPRHLPPDPV